VIIHEKTWDIYPAQGSMKFLNGGLNIFMQLKFKKPVKEQPEKGRGQKISCIYPAL